MHLETQFQWKVDDQALIKTQGKRMVQLLARPNLREKMTILQNMLPKLVQPKLGWERYPVTQFDPKTNAFTIDHGTILHGGPVVGAILGKRNTTEVIIGICTIGPGIDEQVAKFTQEKDQMSALFLDAIGSYLINQVRAQFNAQMDAKIHSEGLHTCFPFLPGDTDWPIQDQKILFSLLDPKALGMELRESMLMIPTKSLSFMIGISPTSYRVEGKTRCDYCGRRNTCHVYQINHPAAETN